MDPERVYFDFVKRYAVAVPVVEAVLVGVAYWSTHQYPIGAGGFHLLTAETIRSQGFALPTAVPHQIPGGVPFAYPPLAFYFVAALMTTGISGISILFYVPVILLALQGVVVYKLSDHILDNSIGALLTATVVVTSADVLKWHLNAGAAVRGFAFLFTVIGLYCAVRAFEVENRLLTWWLLPAATSFAIVTMSHPSTALFFVISTVWAFLVYEFDLRGFVRGLAIGVGGFVICAPWWLQTISTHGPDVYLSAGGTKTVGPSLKFIAAVSMLLTPRSELPTVWYVFVFFGGLYLITERRFEFPAWYLLVALIYPKRRFLMVAGGFIIGAAYTTIVNDPRVTIPNTRSVVFPGVSFHALALSALVIFSTVSGAIYAAGYPGPYSGDETAGQGLFASIDRDDMEAFRWIRENTDRNATFAAQGIRSEWLPYFTRRTLVLGVAGYEWVGADVHERQRRFNNQLSSCPTAECLESVLDGSRSNPDYVLVHNRSEMRRTLENSGTFEIVFENQGVVVARVGMTAPAIRPRQ